MFTDMGKVSAIGLWSKRSLLAAAGHLCVNIEIRWAGSGLWKHQRHRVMSVNFTDTGRTTGHRIIMMIVLRIMIIYYQTGISILTYYIGWVLRYNDLSYQSYHDVLIVIWVLLFESAMPLFQHCAMCAYALACALPKERKLCYTYYYYYCYYCIYTYTLLLLLLLMLAF